MNRCPREFCPPEILCPHRQLTWAEGLFERGRYQKRSVHSLSYGSIKSQGVANLLRHPIGLGSACQVTITAARTRPTLWFEPTYIITFDLTSFHMAIMGCGESLLNPTYMCKHIKRMPTVNPCFLLFIANRGRYKLFLLNFWVCYYFDGDYSTRINRNHCRSGYLIAPSVTKRILCLCL